MNYSYIRELTNTDKLSNEDKDYLISLYDSQLKYIDENVKKIVQALRSKDMLKNTIIIITSDHGEEFWEHSNYGHGHTLYNELLHIPLIIAGNELKHLVITTQVRSIDLLPTILDMIKIKSDKFHLQGVSLLKVIHRDNSKHELPVFATGCLYGDEKYCLIKDNMKIILNTGKTKRKVGIRGYRSKDKLELYNLINDPLEKNNIIRNNNIKIPYHLLEDLNKFLNTAPKFKSQRIDVDKKTKEELKTLGYIK